MLHKRLIYAEDLGTAVREYCKELIDQGKREMCVVDFNAHIQKIIKQQPTASILDEILKGEVDEDSNRR